MIGFIKYSFFAMMVLFLFCGGSSGTGEPFCHIAFEQPPITVIDKGEQIGAHSVLAADSSQLWIAYGDLKKRVLKAAARKNSDSFTIEEILPDEIKFGSCLGRCADIDFDENGNVAVAYYEEEDLNLQIAFREDSGWKSEVVDAEEMVGMDVSMAVDKIGNIHLAYLDFVDGDLRYSKGKKGNWSNSIIDFEEYVGNDPSIAIGGDGSIHISYYFCGNFSASGCSSGKLRYAVNRGKGFEIETIEQEGDNGWYSSLALDKKSNPHISFYSHGSRQLKYANKSNGKWNIEVVDEEEGKGEFSSLALVNENIFIAYYDNKYMRLRFAEKYSKPDAMLIIKILDDSGSGKYASLFCDWGCYCRIAYFDEKNGALKLIEFDGISDE